MKYLLSILALVFLRTVAAAEDAPSSALTWSYQFVLATSIAETQLEPVLKDIESSPTLRDTHMLDFLAEVLHERSSDRTYPSANIVSLVRILAADESGRYRTVLERASAVNSIAGAQGKSKSYIKKYSKAASEQYVPGTVNLHKLNEAYVQSALAAEPSAELAKRLAALSPETTIEKLFEVAGKPQQVVSGQTEATDGLLIRIKIIRLGFYYRGVGRAMFGYKRGKGWQFQAVVTDPLAFEPLMPYRSEAAKYEQVSDDDLDMIQLLSGYPSSMKIAVVKHYRQLHVRQEFMDTAAEVLLKSYPAATDPIKIDVYAWICRLLGERGERRYENILAMVAKDTTNEKLKRYASLPIKGTATMASKPYEAGTISITDQKSKYPSIYPESTFVSGRL